MPVDKVHRDQTGQPLPGLADLAERIRDLVSGIGEVEPMTVRWTAPTKKPGKSEEATDEDTGA
jgi:hypothetical protein